MGAPIMEQEKLEVAQNLNYSKFCTISHLNKFAMLFWLSIWVMDVVLLCSTASDMRDIIARILA